jgi:hypothetical protein
MADETRINSVFKVKFITFINKVYIGDSNKT